MSSDTFNPGMPITITIPLELKNVEVIFWMRPFTTDTLKTRYKINHPYSSLYIQRVLPYNDRQNLDPASNASLSFCVSQFNLEDVKEMFREALSWFTSENMNILYGKNDEGLLMFNSEYQKLSAICVNEYGKAKTALKIVPTVVEVGNNIYEPGVIFYINMVANGIVMRVYELKRLANFIIDFNFIPYNQFALQCFQHCLTTGAILSREQVQKRLDSQRQYNTNFRY